MNTLTHIEQHSPLTKASALSYGIIAYVIGVAGLGAIIFGMANILPLGSMVSLISHPALAFGFNVALTCLFGVQHSVMARASFKKRFNRLFDPAIERSTFVAASGIVSIIIVVLWQPVGGVVWQAETQSLKSFLWFGFVFGWAYLLAASFAINHWDLFGLRQAWMFATNQPYTQPPFNLNWMYRFSRHPLMLGALIGMWCVPTMTLTQMAFSITFTIYIFIGVAHEEKDLIRTFGNEYREYKKKVGMFFTLN